MTNIHIDDKKTFTSNLFIKDTFDDYMLVEASFTTFNTYTIDGRIQKKFYTQEEYEEKGSPELSKWSDVKKLCFEMIKGNKTPLKFKVVLKMSKDKTSDIVNAAAGTLTEDDVAGLMLNIKFENDSMDCITAATLKIFSMDKSVEEAFDRYVEKMLG
jgi:hypothetical protein